MFIRNGNLFNAKLTLSFERDKEEVNRVLKKNGQTAYGKLMGDAGLYVDWRKAALTQMKRKSAELPEAKEAEEIILNERKKIISDQIKQAEESNTSFFLENNNIKKFLLIRELLDDFLENIGFHEKQSLISLRAKKTGEGTQLSAFPGEVEKLNEMLASAYSNYDQYVELFRTHSLIADLGSTLPKLDEFILNPVLMIDEWTNNIKSVINDHKKKIKPGTSFDSLTNVWFASLDANAERLTDRILLISNDAVDLRITHLKEKIVKNPESPNQDSIEKDISELNELKAFETYTETELADARKRKKQSLHSESIGFHEACKNLDEAINKPTTPLDLKKLGKRMLNRANQVYKQNMVPEKELPILSRFVNGTANAIKEPSNQSYVDTHFENTKEIIKMKSPWAKMIGSDMLAVSGVLVVTFSIVLACATFGVAGPLSAMGLALGGSMILASTGIALMGTVGLALTGAATLFSARTKKEIKMKNELANTGVEIHQSLPKSKHH